MLHARVNSRVALPRLSEIVSLQTFVRPKTRDVEHLQCWCSFVTMPAAIASPTPGILLEAILSP
jgi:hypothetical protein